MNILGKNKKISYEGEGMRLGLKTLLFHYPGEEEIDSEDKFLAFFINTEQLDDKLFDFCKFWSRRNKLITIETSQRVVERFKKLRNLFIFYDVDSYKNIKLSKKEFIKIRILNKKQLDSSINLANRYCEDKNNWNKILLMPEFDLSNVKKTMVEVFDKIHFGIRFMPPVQDIIKID